MKYQIQPGLRMVENVLNHEVIMKKEKELVELLAKEIQKEIGTDGEGEHILDQFLSYLKTHDRILRDSVYPHLCALNYE